MKFFLPKLTENIILNIAIKLDNPYKPLTWLYLEKIMELLPPNGRWFQAFFNVPFSSLALSGLIFVIRESALFY